MVHKSLLKYCFLSSKIYSGKNIRIHENRLDKLVCLDAKKNSQDMVITKKILKPEISEDLALEISISHDSLRELFSYNLIYKDLPSLTRSTPILNYIQKLIMDAASKVQSSQKLRIEIDPFESYIYHIFSQRLPCVWLGLFENSIEWKDILAKEKFKNGIDFILLDQHSIMILECARQYTSKRSPVGEIEIKKLLHFKEKLRHHDLQVRAVFICGEKYTDNSAFFKKIRRKYGTEVLFMFEENIAEVVSNILKINNQEDILQYCINPNITYSDNNFD